jgi:hypothetical protein
MKVMDQESVQSSVPLPGSLELPQQPSRSGLGVRPAQDATSPCPTCAAHGTSTVSFVYAIGRIEARFPRLAIEKEFAQATARASTKGKTDRTVLAEVLSQRENRYLTRQMCWVFSIQGLETYLLKPRDAADLDLLVDAIKAPSATDPWINCIVGIRGPIAPPELCNGLMVPVVGVDQMAVSSAKCNARVIEQRLRVDESWPGSGRTPQVVCANCA